MKPSISKALVVVCALTVGTVANSYAADKSSEKGNQTESTSSYVSDSAITAKVKTALITNKLTGISVKTDMGVVTLSGNAPTEETRLKIAKIAASVEGVRGVDYMSITVKPAA